MPTSILFQQTAARAVALRAQEAPAGDLIDMAAEFPAGSSADPVRRAAADAVERHLCDHYARRPGIAPLCRAVAVRLAAEGVPLGENDVVISGSVDEARYVAARVLAAGKQVYLASPVASSLATGLQFAGVSPVAVDPAGQLPVAHGGLLVYTSVNPATGQLIARDALHHLAQWAVEYDLVVLADETAALIHAQYARVHVAALPDMAQRTLTVGSFGDAPGLAAWQVSWFAGHKTVLTPVRDLKQSITICTNAPGQYAALAALDGADHEALPQYAERQEAILALLDRYHIPYFEPHTAAYVVADVSTMGGGLAVAAACRQVGLRVGDGASFGQPDRIRLATPSTTLGAALDRLAAAFSALGKRAAE